MGARDAPDTIRQAIANLPYTDGDNHLPTYCLNDSGEIICQGNDLETAQKELADGVGYIIKNNHTPIILGGGHETAFGVFRGLHQAYPIQTRIGVLNFDAHFDLRTTQDNVPTSGTPFYDVYALCAKEGRAFTYFCVGIAPGGVSALNPMGIHPALGEQCIIELLNHDIVIAALDVVEVNLKFDPDNITAKLASRFVYTFMT